MDPELLTRLANADSLHVGLVSDTHIPEAGETLYPQVIEAFADVPLSSPCSSSLFRGRITLPFPKLNSMRPCLLRDLPTGIRSPHLGFMYFS